MSRTHSELACPDPDDFAAFLSARLDPASVRALEAHVSGCAACRELLSALASTSPAAVSAVGPRDADSFTPTMPLIGVTPVPELASGARVGRYVVVERLGEGGMGVVYAAHDPELHRKVALKLLRGDGGDPAAQEPWRERLRHEAQAMAQLAHPNVVAVHDVGRFGDRIFLAMELVEGETLAQWLASAPRRWREVLAMFLQAGHGLAAAHAAGLVHRDFKPENVLVGRDGRVRVSDFGLARTTPLELATGAPAARSSSHETASGALVGTPYYMAPEQYRGERSDERSDQFSYCVALHAALTGTHPFAGDDLETRVAAVLDGRLRAPARPDPLPRWLRRVLERGLAVDPAARHASMPALLAALTRDRSRRIAAAAGSLALLAVLGLGGVIASRTVAAPPPMCQGAERSWAGVWDPARASAIERAFAATGKPYAASAAGQVRRALDAYRGAWVAMHTDACEATRVRGEQSEELLEKRMMCLDTRLRDARALTDRFAGAAADAAVVEQAPRAVGALGDLASCADLQALSSQVRPPAEPAVRVRVAELRGQLAELRAARLAAGAAGAAVGASTKGARPGRERASALLDAARATRYRPLEAEVLFELGWLDDAGGDYPAARQAFEQAVWAAEASHHDELAARAWTRLMLIEGERLARHTEALALAPRVTALLERMGGHDEIEGLLHVASSQLLFAVDRYAEAAAEAGRAHALLERRFGPDDLRVADALDQLGDVAEHDSPAEARRHYQRALAIRRKVFGDEHPEIGRALNRIAGTYWYEIAYDEAIASYLQALAIFERTLDPDHPDLSKLAHNLALVYEAQGHYAKALVLHQRAVDVGAKAFGRDHPTYAVFLMSLGHTLVPLDRDDEALAALHEALGILERKLGAEHTRVAICLDYILEMQYFLGRYQEARANAQRSIAIKEKQFGADTPSLRSPLLFLGWSELELGAPERALAPLERAYALQANADPGQVAQIQFALARALVASGHDRARGLSLARAARRHMASDDRLSELRKDLDRWLAKQNPPASPRLTK